MCGEAEERPPPWEVAALQMLFSAEVQEDLRLYENYNGREKIIISGAGLATPSKQVLSYHLVWDSWDQTWLCLHTDFSGPPGPSEVMMFNSLFLSPRASLVMFSHSCLD